MKKIYLTVLIALFAGFASADVTITNLVVAQRPGTKLVDITYDVSSTTTNQVWVSLTVSNGSAAVTAVSLTGQIGLSVATGTGKAIVWNAGADWNGNLATLTYALKADETPPPQGMVAIPAGTNSGTDPDFGAYSLTVSNSFYMDSTLVTKAQWDVVYSWALTNGYSFDNAGSGKATNHPVLTVSWYDCVKWCNARSQKESRTPCYTTNGVVYKTGQNTIVACDVSLTGYRLPTMAEGEYAARGGLSSKRFPWGDTITHSNANYYSYWKGSVPYYSYDVNPTSGYHPTYATGSRPYTSPVGSFAPNGYGLYDMAGNVWEWCWDSLGSSRRFRGGGWDSTASDARCGYAPWSPPAFARDDGGFRAVQRASSSTFADSVSSVPVDTRDYQLIVSSEHGTPVPNIGTNVYAWMAAVNGTVVNAVTSGLTNWTSAGWSGSGSVPAAGASTNTGNITLTGLVSSIVWNWNTNYWLQVETAGNGIVSTQGGWQAAKTSVQIGATPNTYYHFTEWVGDTEGDVNSSLITLVMSYPRWVIAYFAPNLTTNTATPEWWLAQYGLTNYNTDAVADRDLDGLMAWQEYIAGTDPTNAASCLKVAQTNRDTVTWSPVTGRIYSVCWSTNLVQGFTNLATGVQPPYTNAAPSTRANFYQVRVQLQ